MVGLELMTLQKHFGYFFQSFVFLQFVQKCNKYNVLPIETHCQTCDQRCDDVKFLMIRAKMQKCNKHTGQHRTT